MAYTPDAGTFDWTEKVLPIDSDEPESYASLCSSTTEATYSTKDFNWRILKIDEKNDSLTIVADGLLYAGISLRGANGYNNGVLILHTIGQRLFSKKSIGAIGRSLTIEDSDWFELQYTSIDYLTARLDFRRDFIP